MDAKAHWEDVHADAGADEVSWYQGVPTRSLAHLDAVHAGPETRILDVGCGQSGLAAHLLERGHRRVTALDISAEAIARARARLGARAADAVRWVEADVLTYTPEEPFDVWHDRAVFHFLTDPLDQRRYVEAVRRALARGGHLLLATFAPDGPERCSGLPVARHDAASLARILGDGFALLASETERHVTPWGAEQAFTWTRFRHG